MKYTVDTNTDTITVIIGQTITVYPIRMRDITDLMRVIQDKIRLNERIQVQ